MPKKELHHLMIQLEAEVASLYDRFAVQYPEDADFWRDLRDEEYEHERALAADGVLEAYLSELSTEDHRRMAMQIQGVCGRVRELRDAFRQHLPPRREALFSALQLELAAGEFHHHEARRMAGARLDRLGFEDEAHAERIRARLSSVAD